MHSLTITRKEKQEIFFQIAELVFWTGLEVRIEKKKIAVCTEVIDFGLVTMGR